MIQIQATFIGYGGRPVSLFSAYDSDSKVLVISAEGDYRVERRAGAIVITNDRTINQRDRLFEESTMKLCIDAFYALRNGIASDLKSQRLVFTERAVRANPEQSIEKDGIDATGTKYRVSDGVTCSQVAALATCLYATKSDAIINTVQMAESMRVLLSGGIYSV